MIGKINDTGDTYQLVKYLLGPGDHNEHENPHLVAASSNVLVNYELGALLLEGQAESIAVRIDLFMNERDVELWGHYRHHGKYVTIKNEDGTVKVDKAGKPVRAKGRNHVWHTSLVLDAGEQLDAQTWGRLVEDYLTEMGIIDPNLSNISWAAFHHGKNQNGNDHVHIVVNRVRENASDPHWSTWRDETKSSKVCTMLEEKYGLQVLESRKVNRNASQDTQADRDRAKRAGKSYSERVELEMRLRATALEATSEIDFLRRLRARNVQVKPYFKKGSNKQVVGYSVKLRVGTQWYAATSVAKDLRLSVIRQRWPEPSSEELTLIAQEWNHGQAVTPRLPRMSVTDFQAGIHVLADRIRRTSPTDIDGLTAATSDLASFLAAGAVRTYATKEEREAWINAARTIGRYSQITRHMPRSLSEAALQVAAQIFSGGFRCSAYPNTANDFASLLKMLANNYEQAGQPRTSSEIIDATIQVVAALDAQAASRIPMPGDVEYDAFRMGQAMADYFQRNNTKPTPPAARRTEVRSEMVANADTPTVGESNEEQRKRAQQA